MSTPPTSDRLVPLALLAFETGVPLENLLRQLDNVVTLDEAGFRCVTAETARAFIEAQHSLREFERQRLAADRAEAKQAVNEDRERLRQWQRQQRALGGPSGSALSDLASGGAR